jgi:hypothetical protein
MLLKFIFFCLIFIFAGGGYIFFTQPSMLNQMIQDIGRFVPAVKDIKGISTSENKKIPDKIKKEVDKEVKKTEKQAMDIKVGDLKNLLDNGQKYIKDFRDLQEYVKREAANLLKESSSSEGAKRGK